MAERYLSSQDDDNSLGRDKQSRTSGRKSRKRRIRVTQNGQPGDDVLDSPSVRSAAGRAETIVERTTRRVTRPADQTGYVSSTSATRGYDDYLDDDFLDDDFIDDDLVDDRLVDEIEIRERRTTARRPAHAANAQRRSAARYGEYDNGYEEDRYGESRYEETYYDDGPRPQRQHAARGYVPRTSLRSPVPNLSLPGMALPHVSMPRRPRMPQLPIRGGLSDLVGRCRVAMALLMGLLAFIGYSISTNARGTTNRRAERVVSARQQPQYNETRYASTANTTVNRTPINLTTQHDIAWGRESARQFLNTHGGLSKNDNLRVRVRQIGNQLAMNSPTAKTTFPFHFDVLADTQSVAAYDLPGGQIYLTTGLINQLKDDNEIAAVLAHEMGHVMSRHAVSRLANTRLPSGNNGDAVIASLLDPASYSVSGTDVAQLIRETGAIRYGASEVRNSDLWAIRCLLDANIDPNALTSAMQRVNKVSGRSTAFAARHPSAIDRHAVINQAISQYQVQTQSRQQPRS